MAPAKRVRPSFSPPRPNKSKSKPTAASTSLAGREAPWKNQKDAAIARKRAIGKSKHSGRKGTRGAQLSDEDDEESEEDTRGRSALALVDASASETEDDEGNQDRNGNDSDSSNHSRSSHRTNLNSSPEPDLILAEITHATSPTQAPIPEQLVHKMLHAHFERPEKTKISVDARELVTRYLDLFVREAITRSAYEKQQREGGEDGLVGGGFLEVEDLEKTAVQLCLDF